MEPKPSTIQRVFDFRMDKISWVFLLIMVLLFGLVILPSQFGVAADTVNVIYYVAFSLLLTFILVAVSCLPIVLVCLVINRIPDIDYAIWLALALTIMTAIGSFI